MKSNKKGHSDDKLSLPYLPHRIEFSYRFRKKRTEEGFGTLEDEMTKRKKISVQRERAEPCG